MGLVSACSLLYSAICRVSSYWEGRVTSGAAACHPSWTRGTPGKAFLGVCGGDACRPLHLRSKAAATAHQLPLPAGKEAHWQGLRGLSRAAWLLREEGCLRRETRSEKPKGE